MLKKLRPTSNRAGVSAAIELTSEFDQRQVTPGWLPKIEKGPESEPGTPSDLDLLVGTAGFEPATP